MKNSRLKETYAWTLESFQIDKTAKNAITFTFWSFNIYKKFKLKEKMWRQTCERESEDIAWGAKYLFFCLRWD